MDKTNVVPIKAGGPLDPLEAVFDRMAYFRAALTCAEHVTNSEAETESAIRAAMLLSRCVKEFDELYNAMDAGLIVARGREVANA